MPSFTIRKNQARPNGPGTSSLAGILPWPDGKTVNWGQFVTAALGPVLPILLGFFTGRLELGLIASLGGLALGGEAGGQTVKEQISGLIYALTAGSMAIFAGASLNGHGMITAVAFPVIAGTAGLVGSISRPLARTTTLFIIYCIIALPWGARGFSPLVLTLLFSLGGLWTAFLSLVLRRLLPAFLPSPPEQESMSRPAQYSAGKLLRRWVKSLGHLSGWQYALRITICLMAGGVFVWQWPQQHGYWILITLVIVIQRDFRVMLPRLIHRSAGTIAGVLLAGLLLIGSPPVWVTAILVGLLAAGRLLLREANYTTYTAIMTILVILLLDFGAPPPVTALIDRLAATFVGCALALTLDYLPWSKILADPQDKKQNAAA